MTQLVMLINIINILLCINNFFSEATFNLPQNKCPNSIVISKEWSYEIHATKNFVFWELKYAI